MEKTGRYSGYLTTKEIWNVLVRRRYKVVDVFGFPLKVPIKEVESFEESLDLLRVMIEMLDCQVHVAGNNSLLEVVIYPPKGQGYFLNFHLYHIGAIDTFKAPKEKAKLKRVSVSLIGDYYNHKEFERSKDFYLVLDKMQESL